MNTNKKSIDIATAIQVTEQAAHEKGYAKAEPLRRAKTEEEFVADCHELLPTECDTSSMLSRLRVEKQNVLTDRQEGAEKAGLSHVLIDSANATERAEAEAAWTSEVEAVKSQPHYRTPAWIYVISAIMAVLLEGVLGDSVGRELITTEGPLWKVHVTGLCFAGFCIGLGAVVKWFLEQFRGTGWVTTIFTCLMLAVCLAVLLLIGYVRGETLVGIGEPKPIYVLAFLSSLGAVAALVQGLCFYAYSTIAIQRKKLAEHDRKLSSLTKLILAEKACASETAEEIESLNAAFGAGYQEGYKDELRKIQAEKDRLNSQSRRERVKEQLRKKEEEDEKRKKDGSSGSGSGSGSAAGAILLLLGLTAFSACTAPEGKDKMVLLVSAPTEEYLAEVQEPEYWQEVDQVAVFSHSGWFAMESVNSPTEGSMIDKANPNNQDMDLQLQEFESQLKANYQEQIQDFDPLHLGELLDMAIRQESTQEARFDQLELHLGSYDKRLSGLLDKEVVQLAREEAKEVADRNYLFQHPLRPAIASVQQYKAVDLETERKQLLYLSEFFETLNITII